MMHTAIKNLGAPIGRGSIPTSTLPPLRQSPNGASRRLPETGAVAETGTRNPPVEARRPFSFPETKP